MSEALRKAIHFQDPAGTAKVFWFSEAELKELLAECLEEASYDHERALEAEYKRGCADGGSYPYDCCEDCG